MPTGDAPAGVNERVAAIAAACRAAGYSVGAARAVQYGLQLPVADGGVVVPVTVYGGKKGISVVLGGATGTPLYAAVQALARAPSATVAPKAPRATARVAARFPPGPWIGSDESGKGDYFGPLVAAAVYVLPEQEDALRGAGVCDSKLLDDAAARRAAAAVRWLCAGRYAEEVLEPAAYNARYAALKAAGENLNHLLAGAHARVIAAVLTALPTDAQAPLVIADQFANERLVRERLSLAAREGGLPKPKLIQAPRAEANVAVAAASILARDRFLQWLEAAAAQWGVRLPKGGSNGAIVAAARRIAARDGAAALGEVAKLHFATTARVSLVR